MWTRPELLRKDCRHFTEIITNQVLIWHYGTVIKQLRSCLTKQCIRRQNWIETCWISSKFVTVKVEGWTIYDERYLKPKQNTQLLYHPPAHLFVPPSSLVHCFYMNHFEILWGYGCTLIIVNLKVNLPSKIPYYGKGALTRLEHFFLRAVWLRAALHYLNAWDKQLCKLKVMLLLACEQVRGLAEGWKNRDERGKGKGESL